MTTKEEYRARGLHGNRDDLWLKEQRNISGKLASEIILDGDL